MEIKQVYYKKLVSGDDYSNHEIGAWAEVSGRTPADTLTELIYWVHEQFRQIGMRVPDLRELELEVFRKENELRRLERDIQEMTKRAEKAKAFLAKHGISLPDDELPF